MDPEDVIAIVDKIDDGIEKVETEVKETVTNLEQDIEIQKMETQWTNERISNLERNQQEILEKMDSLILKFTNPIPPETPDPLQIIEEVGDDLEKPKEPEPNPGYPFSIF